MCVCVCVCVLHLLEMPKAKNVIPRYRHTYGCIEVTNQSWHGCHTLFFLKILGFDKVRLIALFLDAFGIS